jgi:hypothetical protein
MGFMNWLIIVVLAWTSHYAVFRIFLTIARELITDDFCHELD